MKKFLTICVLMTTLGGCGTAQGIMEGAGEVLEGMGQDARSAGRLFN